MRVNHVLFRLVLWPVAATWTCVGCENADRSVDAMTVRDSAGIRIVENARPSADGDGRWATLESEPSLEIGASEGEAADYTFSTIRAAVETPTGEIVILDGREIRVFDDAGTHLRTIGGRGMGPGEFDDDPWIGLIPPDTILAWDANLRRLTWFTLDGKIAKDHNLAGTQTGQLPLYEFSSGRWVVHSDGTVISHRGDSNGTSRDGFVEEPMRLMIAKGGTGDVRYIRGLPGMPEVRVGNTGLSAFFYPSIGYNNWNVRPLPPAIIAADDPGGRWALSIYDFDGTLTASIRTSLPRREITNELAQSARAWLLEQGANTSREYRTAVERMPVPDSTPATSAVLVDASHQLWVKRWIGKWEQKLTDTYDVIDESGRWLGWVEVNQSFGQILSVGDDHILFDWKGPFDVSFVRKHRFRREEL